MCPINNGCSKSGDKSNGRCWNHRGKQYANVVVEVVAPVVEAPVEVAAPVVEELFIKKNASEFVESNIVRADQTFTEADMSPNSIEVETLYKSDDHQNEQKLNISVEDEEPQVLTKDERKAKVLERCAKAKEAKNEVNKITKKCSRCDAEATTGRLMCESCRTTYRKERDATKVNQTNTNFSLSETALIDKLAECKTSNEKQFIICNEIDKIMKTLPKDLIRETNNLSTYDIVIGDAFDLNSIAKLIKQTVAYIYNDGSYYYICKSLQTIRFKDGDVKVVHYRNMGGDTGNSFKKMSFVVKVGNDHHTINLKDAFDHCKKSLMYKNVDVIPHSPFVKPEVNGEFNLFGQYQHEYDPNFDIDEELVSKWTNHIRDVVAAGDPITGEYLINWFAHLLQFPERKTESVPLIKGTQGCGKNFCFNVFQRYVLNPSLSIVCPDMEKLFSRFNSARLGKLLIVLDEAVDSGDRKMNNKMKNFITEERVQIENKGKDIVEVSDFSNYAVITNNDFSSIIEKNDRRYLCMIASDHMVGNSEYFDDMVKSLLNVNAGKHIFHYLLHRDLSSFKSRAIPKTIYKKELAAKQANNVIKWLLYKYEIFVDNDINDETALTSNEWYKYYQTWCNEIGGESKVYSLNVFNQMMNAEGFESIKKNITKDNKRSSVKQRVISMAILKEKLSEYIH